MVTRIVKRVFEIAHEEVTTFFLEKKNIEIYKSKYTSYSMYRAVTSLIPRFDSWVE